MTVAVSGLAPGTYTVESARVDAAHGNIAATWASLGGGDWPTESQWAELRAADRLPFEYLAEVAVGDDGVATVTVELPMPGIRSPRLTRPRAR